MAHPTRKYITPDEYLRLEIQANEKHEYFDGEVIAMAGASFDHNYIVTNLVREIGYFLKDKGCDLFPSDLRVATPLFDSYTYPDVTIVCDELKKTSDTFDTLINPSIIIEVSSPSTQDRDMGIKLFKYLKIDSLKEYIIIDSTNYHIKVITKNDDNSFVVKYIEGASGSLYIQTIDYTIKLQDIYNKVSFSGIR